MIPPDSCGGFPLSRHAARSVSLTLVPRSTSASERPSWIRIRPTGFRGASDPGSDMPRTSFSTPRCYGSGVASGSAVRTAR